MFSLTKFKNRLAAGDMISGGGVAMPPSTYWGGSSGRNTTLPFSVSAIRAFTSATPSPASTMAMAEKSSSTPANRLPGQTPFSARIRELSVSRPG